MNPPNTIERGEKKERRWEYNGGVELFKAHYMHVWHYHNEIPLYYYIL
jgi:hypothetical protein